MHDVDFTNALAQLLHRGDFRDQFSVSPQRVAESIGVRDADIPAFLRLNVSELEVQARVLLRKRFDAIQRWIPRTCAAFGPEAWERFAQCARTSWPSEMDLPLHDAALFMTDCTSGAEDRVVQTERNRIAYARQPSGWRLRVVRDFLFRDKRRVALQIFFGRGSDRWREHVLFFAF